MCQGIARAPGGFLGKRRTVKLQAVVLTSFVFATLATSVSFASEAEETANLAATAPLLDPSTLVLVGLGLVGLAVFRSRLGHQDED